MSQLSHTLYSLNYTQRLLFLVTSVSVHRTGTTQAHWFNSTTVTSTGPDNLLALLARPVCPMLLSIGLVGKTTTSYSLCALDRPKKHTETYVRTVETLTPVPISAFLELSLAMPIHWAILLILVIHPQTDPTTLTS